MTILWCRRRSRRRRLRRAARVRLKSKMHRTRSSLSAFLKRTRSIRMEELTAIKTWITTISLMVRSIRRINSQNKAKLSQIWLNHKKNQKRALPPTKRSRISKMPKLLLEKDRCIKCGAEVVTIWRRRKPRTPRLIFTGMNCCAQTTMQQTRIRIHTGKIHRASPLRVATTTKWEMILAVRYFLNWTKSIWGRAKGVLAKSSDLKIIKIVMTTTTTTLFKQQ